MFVSMGLIKKKLYSCFIVNNNNCIGGCFGFYLAVFEREFILRNVLYGFDNKKPRRERGFCCGGYLSILTFQVVGDFFGCCTLRFQLIVHFCFNFVRACSRNRHQGSDIVKPRTSWPDCYFALFWSRRSLSRLQTAVIALADQEPTLQHWLEGQK